jgi:hypothetical protein
MAELTQEDVGRIITILNNRLRANPFELHDLTSARANDLLKEFHERAQPEAGAVRSLRPVVLTGRRGAGKTSTMMRTFLELWLQGNTCVWVDVQVLRRDSHASVSAQIVAGLLAEMLAGVPEKRKFEPLRKDLAQLRGDYIEVASTIGVATIDVTSTVHSQRSGGRSLTLGVAAPDAANRVGVTSSVEAQRASSTERLETSTQKLTYDLDPIERLESLISRFRDVVSLHTQVISGDPIFLFLDDFYFIPRGSQPFVADYLHRLFKNLNIWLKIGSVEHRLSLFAGGDPPIGLESPHDVTMVSLDVSLEQFDTSRGFLEKIVSSVCEEADLAIGDLIADTARTRLVLAAGGVPRDYLYLLAAALERHLRVSPVARVSAETINDVAPALLDQKFADMDRDTDGESRSRLLDRLNDIHNFCIQKHRVNVFVVPSEVLNSTEWGRDINALAELRLLHYVGSVTLKTSQKEYVGKRYSAFCLDLSAYAGTRVRSIKQIEFWTADGKQRLRAKEYVYAPQPEPDTPPPRPVVDGRQLMLWDMPNPTVPLDGEQ